MRKNTKSLQKYCTACETTKGVTGPNGFYASSSQLHKDGYVPYCKNCIKKMSMNLNGSLNLEKFKDALRQIDKPFLRQLFTRTLEKCKDKGDVIGQYIKNLQSLPQYKGYTWNDSSDELDDETLLKINEEELVYSKEWRGSFNKFDLDYLDEYYRELNNDFKIITKNHKDYARKIAKASLAMDKAYEDMINGVSGADKKYKDLKDTFDTLSKSAQFSENTRGINDVSLGGFGVVFEKVEQKKWIPQHTPLEKDDFDKLIDYFSTLNRSI
jgi:hypothetical protein